MIVEHIKCECIKYSLPDEDSEPIITASSNVDDLLVAVINNKKNVLLYKIVNKELIYCETFYIGNSNKIIGFEWSKKNELLIITIDMKCIIYIRDEKGIWSYNNVNIPTEELPTCACWHPYAHSFAIGFSSGVIFICSKKNKQKWSIKKLVNHTGSILYLQWNSSGLVLSTNSVDSTSLLICTLDLWEDNIVKKQSIKIFEKIKEFITEKNLKNYDIINKVECKGYIFIYATFSLSNEKVAMIANNFENNCEKQQIIIFDYLKSPIKVHFISWIGQTLHKCLFIDEDKLLVYGYELFPIIIERSNDEWVISKVVLPEFTIKNLTVDFFYDKKDIHDIEKEYNDMHGNKIIGEIVAHSNQILQISMLESYEYKKYTQFITVSSDFNVIVWSFIL
ncbi:conserved Plasmodium protein, unknown function [Plasmodium gallinaceum]|uniref:Actin-related protein 2/3 complex subunit 1 n=1 Tax=Plasmodium gallinaceum TaxID=5849 RepID=A0A1J1GVB6_PLAGA|nr:conserved Plasmodium protein, unknown function [Plasmodium gallinaceum]CRG96236.1 conserved Plasmodium protein, unknown function [Plasmodium gallinaceum]